MRDALFEHDGKIWAGACDREGVRHSHFHKFYPVVLHRPTSKRDFAEGRTREHLFELLFLGKCTQLTVVG